MSNGFIIPARVRVSVDDLSQVTSKIKSGIGGVNAKIGVSLDESSLKNVSNLQNGLSGLGGGLGNIKKAADLAARSLGELNKSGVSVSGLQDLNSDLSATVKSLGRLQHSIGTAKSEVSQFASLAGVSARRFLAFGAVASVFYGVVAATKEGASEAVKFQRELVRIEQVGGDSKGVIKGLADEVSNLSKGLGVSATSLIETGTTLRQAGLSAEDTKGALSALAKTTLAPTFNDIKNTTEGVIAMRQQFDISGKGIEESLGSINAVSAQFAVESEDLVQSVQRAGGAFRAASSEATPLKDQLHQLFGLFTSVRQTTRESAESISTSLRTIFARLQNSTVQNNIKELGVNLRFTADEARLAGKDIEGQFVGADEAIKRLSASVKNVPTTDPRFSALVEQIGGQRQVSKVIPLLQQYGIAQKAVGAAQAGTTSLTRDAEKAQESFLQKVTKLKQEFNDLVRVFADSKGLNLFIDYAIKGASAAITFTKALEPLVPLIAVFGAVKLAKALPVAIPAVARGFTTGSVLHRASGGVIPGIGNTDSVPHMAEAGDFVVKKTSARKFGYGNLSALAGGTPDTPSRGNVPVMVMPGEYYVPRAAAQSIGYNTLRHINETGTMPGRQGYADGGSVTEPLTKRGQLLKTLSDHNIRVTSKAFADRGFNVDAAGLTSRLLVTPEDSMTSVGRYSPDSATVDIRDGMNHSQLLAVLAHEVGAHGADGKAGRLTHNREVFKSDRYSENVHPFNVGANLGYRKVLGGIKNDKLRDYATSSSHESLAYTLGSVLEKRNPTEFNMTGVGGYDGLTNVDPRVENFFHKRVIPEISRISKSPLDTKPIDFDAFAANVAEYNYYDGQPLHQLVYRSGKLSTKPYAKFADGGTIRQQGFLDFGAIENKKERQKALSRIGNSLFDKTYEAASPEQAHSLKRYIRYSGRINAVLRGNHDAANFNLDENGLDHYQHAENIKQFLGKRKLPTGLVLYRGVDDDIFRQMTEGDGGKGFIDHGALSTSLDPSIAMEFGKKILRIRANKGTLGAYINRSQHEVLLHPGSSGTFAGISKLRGRRVIDTDLRQKFANGGSVTEPLTENIGRYGKKEVGLGARKASKLVGKSYASDRFLSTSLSPKIASEFGDEIIRINAPHDTKGALINTTQREFVLPHGTNLHFHGYDEENRILDASIVRGFAAGGFIGQPNPINLRKHNISRVANNGARTRRYSTDAAKAKYYAMHRNARFTDALKSGRVNEHIATLEERFARYADRKHSVMADAGYSSGGIIKSIHRGIGGIVKNKLTDKVYGAHRALKNTATGQFYDHTDISDLTGSGPMYALMAGELVARKGILHLKRKGYKVPGFAEGGDVPESKIQVSDLAKQFGLSNKNLIQIANDSGFPEVKHHANKIPVSIAKKLEERIRAGASSQPTVKAENVGATPVVNADEEDATPQTVTPRKIKVINYEARARRRTAKVNARLLDMYGVDESGKPKVTARTNNGYTPPASKSEAEDVGHARVLKKGDRFHTLFNAARSIVSPATSQVDIKNDETVDALNRQMLQNDPDLSKRARKMEGLGEYVPSEGTEGITYRFGQQVGNYAFNQSQYNEITSPPPDLSKHKIGTKSYYQTKQAIESTSLKSSVRDIDDLEEFERLKDIKLNGPSTNVPPPALSPPAPVREEFPIGAASLLPKAVTVPSFPRFETPKVSDSAIGVTDEEKNLARFYTKRGDREINEPLRSGGHSESASVLDSFISKHQLSEPKVLYRGVGYGNHDFIQRFENKLGDPSSIGKVFVDPGYLSTSTNKNIASDFAGDEGVKMRIAVPAGVKAADISGISHRPVEKEYLLPRSSPLRYEGKKEGFHNFTYATQLGQDESLVPFGNHAPDIETVRKNLGVATVGVQQLETPRIAVSASQMDMDTRNSNVGVPPNNSGVANIARRASSDRIPTHVHNRLSQIYGYGHDFNAITGYHEVDSLGNIPGVKLKGMYSKKNKAITVTKSLANDNSLLAHEFTHALDHAAGVRAGYSGFASHIEGHPLAILAKKAEDELITPEKRKVYAKLGKTDIRHEGLAQLGELFAKQKLGDKSDPRLKNKRIQELLREYDVQSSSALTARYTQLPIRSTSNVGVNPVLSPEKIAKLRVVAERGGTENERDIARRKLDPLYGNGSVKEVQKPVVNPGPSLALTHQSTGNELHRNDHRFLSSALMGVPAQLPEWINANIGVNPVKAPASSSMSPHEAAVKAFYERHPERIEIDRKRKLEEDQREAEFKNRVSRGKPVTEARVDSPKSNRRKTAAEHNAYEEKKRNASSTFTVIPASGGNGNNVNNTKVASGGAEDDDKDDFRKSKVAKDGSSKRERPEPRPKVQKTFHPSLEEPVEEGTFTQRRISRKPLPGPRSNKMGFSRVRKNGNVGITTEPIIDNTPDLSGVDFSQLSHLNAQFIPPQSSSNRIGKRLASPFAAIHKVRTGSSRGLDKVRQGLSDGVDKFVGGISGGVSKLESMEKFIEDVVTRTKSFKDSLSNKFADVHQRYDKHGNIYSKEFLKEQFPIDPKKWVNKASSLSYAGLDKVLDNKFTRGFIAKLDPLEKAIGGFSETAKNFSSSVAGKVKNINDSYARHGNSFNKEFLREQFAGKPIDTYRKVRDHAISLKNGVNAIPGVARDQLGKWVTALKNDVTATSSFAKLIASANKALRSFPDGVDKFADFIDSIPSRVSRGAKSTFGDVLTPSYLGGKFKELYGEAAKNGTFSPDFLRNQVQDVKSHSGKLPDMFSSFSSFLFGSGLPNKKEKVSAVDYSKNDVGHVSGNSDLEQIVKHGGSRAYVDRRDHHLEDFASSTISLENASEFSGRQKKRRGKKIKRGVYSYNYENSSIPLDVDRDTTPEGHYDSNPFVHASRDRKRRIKEAEANYKNVQSGRSISSPVDSYEFVGDDFAVGASSPIGGFGKKRSRLARIKSGLRSARFKNISGSLAVTAAVAGATYAPSLIEGYTGTVDNPNGRNGFGQQGAKYGAAAGSAVAGGLTGALIGFQFGGPVGSAIGGAVGALAGFTSSLKEGEKKIKEIQLDKDLAKFGKTLEEVASGKFELSGTRLTEVNKGLKIHETEAREKSPQDGSGFFDMFYSQRALDARHHNNALKSEKEFSRIQRESLNNILPSLQGTAEQTVSRVKLTSRDTEGRTEDGTPLSAADLSARKTSRFQAYSNTGIAPVVSKIAEAREISVKQVYEELDKVAIAANKSRLAFESDTKVISLETLQIQRFNRIGQSVDAAASAVKNLDDRADSLSSAFDGVIRAIPVKSFGTSADLGGMDTEGFNKSADFVADSIGGSLGQHYKNTVKDFHEASNRLPDIISNANASGVDGKGLADNILKGLGNLPREIQGKLSEAVSAFSPEDLSKEASDNPQKLSQKLLGSIGGDVVRDTHNKAVGGIEDRNNNFGQKLASLQDMITRTGDAKTKLANLQVNEAQLRTNARADALGRPSDNQLSLRTLFSPFDQNQERLTGLTGPEALDPAKIGEKLQKTRSEIETTTKDRDNASGKDRDNLSQRLSTLQGNAQRLGQALVNLRDETEKSVAIQEKLNRIDEDREGRISFTQKLLTASPSEKREMNISAFAANSAFDQGHFANFSPRNVQRVVEHLSSLGKTQVTPDGYTAEDVLKQLTVNSAMMIGGIHPDAERRRNGLMNQQADLAGNRTKAQAEIIKDNESLQKGFFDTLQKTQDEFFDKLAKNLTDGERKGLMNERGRILSAKGSSEAALNSLGKVRKFGLNVETAKSLNKSEDFANLQRYMKSKQVLPQGIKNIARDLQPSMIRGSFDVKSKRYKLEDSSSSKIADLVSGHSDINLSSTRMGFNKVLEDRLTGYGGKPLTKDDLQKEIKATTESFGAFASGGFDKAIEGTSTKISRDVFGKENPGKEDVEQIKNIVNNPEEFSKAVRTFEPFQNDADLHAKHRSAISRMEENEGELANIGVLTAKPVARNDNAGVVTKQREVIPMTENDLNIHRIQRKLSKYQTPVDKKMLKEHNRSIRIQTQLGNVQENIQKGLYAPGAAIGGESKAFRSGPSKRRQRVSEQKSPNSTPQSVVRQPRKGGLAEMRGQSPRPPEIAKPPVTAAPTSHLNSASTNLNGAAGTVNSAVNNLAKVLASIPNEIAIKRDGKIEVVINGTEMMKTLQMEMTNRAIQDVVAAVTEKLPGILAGLPATA